MSKIFGNILKCLIKPWFCFYIVWWFITHSISNNLVVFLFASRDHSSCIIICDMFRVFTKRLKLFVFYINYNIYITQLSFHIIRTIILISHTFFILRCTWLLVYKAIVTSHILYNIHLWYIIYSFSTYGTHNGIQKAILK